MERKYRAIGSKWGSGATQTYYDLMIKNKVLLVGSEYDLTTDYLYAVKEGKEIKAIAKIKENFKSYDSDCPISVDTLRSFEIDPDYVKYAKTEFILILEKGIDSRDIHAAGIVIHTDVVVNKLNEELDKYLSI